jgi:hypothetical protein
MHLSLPVLFIAVLALDVHGYRMIGNTHIDLAATGTYVDLSGLASLLQAETDVIAALFYLYYARLGVYLMYNPLFGQVGVHIHLVRQRCHERRVALQEVASTRPP